MVDSNRFELALRQRVHRQRLCVLIIDSHPLSQFMAIEALGEDYEIVTAVRGAAALKTYESCAPDIVFLDMDLPDMSSREVLGHIVRLDQEAYVIVMAKGKTQKKGRESLLFGAQGCVVKPFTRRKIALYLSHFGQVYPNRGTKLA